MKSYKLVNSKEVQKKAVILGYKYFKRTEVERFKAVFMFLYWDGGICFGSTLKEYNDPSFTEITQADFLALPEPLKNGDWVKISDGIDSFVGKIDHIEDDELSFDLCHENYNMSTHDIIQLTKEQIEVLGLC